MKDIEKAVIKMQQYIDENLNENITLTALAKVSLFSPWYSYRLFIQFTSLSPSEYIRKKRLEQACKHLKKDNSQVTNIAYEVGFKSVDGFIRAFAHEFGVTPGLYKQNISRKGREFSFNNLLEKGKKETIMKNVNNVFIQVITKPQRKVIIKRGIKAIEYWDYCNEVGCDIWTTLVNMTSLCKEPVCLWLPDEYILENTSKYVQGVEVDMDYCGDIPEGFDIITLPKQDYLMFQGEKFEEEDYCDAIACVQQSMEKYNPSIIGYEWDDSSPKIQLEPIGERGYIELKPVKKIQ